jgi:hypothetical protein
VGIVRWLSRRAPFAREAGYVKVPTGDSGQQTTDTAVVGMPVPDATVNGSIFPGRLPEPILEIQKLVVHAKVIVDDRENRIALCALDDFHLPFDREVTVPTGIRPLVRNGVCVLEDVENTGLTVVNRLVKSGAAIDIKLRRSADSARTRVYRGQTIAALRVEPCKLFKVNLARRETL